MPFSELPLDYRERVYAGVLGKIIGVYLGRPFEGWLHDRIVAELGEVDHYVHDKLNCPLVVTDDDISGTFTFLRALEDHGFDPGLTAAQIGDTWLNYLIEKRTVLWWGGIGTSTEHTAYLRLKNGVPAPASGSIALNGATVAEQIGSQIFIDGWGLIHPNDPDSAAHYARLAASVSHDGAAIDGAVVVAVMVSAAFGGLSTSALIDVALTYIPADGVIARLIGDVRRWHAEGLDWKKGFGKIQESYGYDKFGGGCHMVPNHAIIIHALLHGEGDFQRSLMIANTCGWDTDCNSGNVGAIVGVQLGLAAIDAGPDWRGPVADRILIPTADGGRTVSDAVRETEAIVTTAKRLRGEEAVSPKDGARFHFSYPGSVQGFDGPVENYEGKLRLRSDGTARTLTRTWITPEDKKIAGYGLYASPTVYSGQVVRASVVADRPVVARLVVEIYDRADQLQSVLGPSVSLEADVVDTLEWALPDFEGYPVARVGIEVDGSGVVDLDWLRWDGAPQVRFIRTAGGKAFRTAWTDAVEDYPEWAPGFRLTQNEGVGLISAGTREWTDYAVSASLSLALGERFGLVARYQGLRRYYALVLSGDGRLQLVRMFNDEVVLDERDVAMELNREYRFELRVSGSDIVGVLDGETVLRATDEAFANGGIGLLAEAGRMDASWVEVRGVS